MTGILADTSVIIEALEKRTDETTRRILEEQPISGSILSYYEVLKFILKIGRSKDQRIIRDKLRQFDFLPVTESICERAASLSHTDGFSTADAIIYATAQANGLKLLTSDSDFKGKPGVLFAEPKR